MSKKKKILAIIPARGNSKRLLRKNIKLLNGRPLIAYTIEAAINCSLISRVIVSTEDNEIASIARNLGVEVQKRPVFLSQDDVGNDQVISYVLQKIIEETNYYETLVLLQPTSPLRTANDINQCLYNYMMSEGHYKSAMSICQTEQHPAKAVILNNNELEPYVDIPSMEMRSQLLPSVYRQNGAIYVVQTSLFQKTKRLYQPPCLAYIMDPRHSIDVDAELDLKLAELVLNEEKPNDSCC